MKRLFRIGGGLLVSSIIPIFTYLVLSWVIGDNRIANIFSLTYPIQFVCLIFRQLFATGANIRKEKEGNKDCVWSSLIIGVIVASGICIALLINIDKYIQFFGQDTKFYRIYIRYGIAYLFVQLLLLYIIEKLYFEYKEKLANIHLIIFNAIAFIFLIGLSLIIPRTEIAFIITIVILLLYVIGIYVWQFEKFKFDFKILKKF